MQQVQRRENSKVRRQPVLAFVLVRVLLLGFVQPEWLGELAGIYTVFRTRPALEHGLLPSNYSPLSLLYVIDRLAA
jgi:hypothetical protein